MKTQEKSTLLQEFLGYGLRHAEKVYEKHIADYCQEGSPFLTEGTHPNNLVEYARQALMVCVSERFAGKACEELEEVNFDLLYALYMEMFCSRYKELVSFLNGERL